MSKPERPEPGKHGRPYAGRWVARLGGRIVAQGGTPRQALLAAKAARSKETPQVEFMPSEMNYLLPAIVERVRQALPANQEIYLVGGAVRDLLLGRTHHDFDFVLPAKAIAAARRVANALAADFYPLDETRDAGRVLLTESGERISLDFIAFMGKDIDGDLAARDLTVNAMAIDLRNPDALLDPFGGAADIRAKRIRGCSPEAFRSDPVRILRAVRLAATLGMKIEKETRQHLRAAAPRLTSVSPERMRDELFRLLESPKLAASLRALDLLDALGVVFPELPSLKGIEQPSPHAFDVWGHTFNVIEKLEAALALLAGGSAPEGAADLHSGLVALSLGRYRPQISELMKQELVSARFRRALLMLAAIFHDTGKPGTRSVEESGRIRFIGHEDESAELAAQHAKTLHLSNAEIELLESVVRLHGRPFALTRTGAPPTRRAIYRFFREAGEAGVDICLLSLADFMGKYAADLPQEELTKHLVTLRTLLEAFFENPEQAVQPLALLNGDELMQELGLTPGPKVGEILEELREAQAAGEVRTRDEALAFAKSRLG
ncbi:MAG: HD domain-containing protein [Anaerolineales bacterium]